MAKEHAAMVAPDARKLAPRQAARLAEVSGVDAKQLVGRTVTELRKQLAWRIDPELLLFRRVCGRVVRHDPVTGQDWPVPGATVHVYDTDVHLLWYFPEGSPFGWHWPFHWTREEIATATTDECGEFCAWIPRWDIDWVLRWRLERECFIDLLRKPSVRDLLERLREVVEVPKGPPPGPDPGPLAFLRGGVASPNVLRQVVPEDMARRLQATVHTVLGEPSRTSELLDAPAFPTPVPPPLHADAHGKVLDVVRALPREQHTRLAALKDQDELRAASLAGWQGPFLRCVDVLVPELVPIFDVPDITFSVTQDVDNDGVEETIYDEGFFDVRWDATSIPPVTLYAAPFAFATPTCGHGDPDLGPCEVPQLVLVGQMPLVNPTGAGTFPFVDTTTGYAVRPDRPHASGRVDEVPAATVHATAPVAGLLEIWGCAHHTADGTPADHYRILQRLSTDGGTTWGPQTPIIDTWSNWRVVGNPPVLQYKGMTQLPGGWWEVLNPADQWMPGDHYLLQWHNAPDGLIELVLELGQLSGTSVNPIGQATAVRLQNDNSAPHPAITSLEWRSVPGGSWTPLPLNCPTIHRKHSDIEIRVGVSAWASHLRSVFVGAAGCGGGNPKLAVGFESLETGAVTHPEGYWHKSQGDNNVSQQVVWYVPASLSPGAYSVAVTAHSRAFYPGDGHVYVPTQADVGYDPAPIWRDAWQGIAIVD